MSARFCAACGYHLGAIPGEASFCPSCGCPVGRSVTERRLGPHEAIFVAAADVCHVTVAQVLSTSRDLSVARARHLIAYLLRADSGMSYPQIGTVLGRDHTTVIHAVRHVETTPKLMTLAALVRTRAAMERSNAA